MQTINLDISTKNIVPLLYAKQGDVGRKFKATLTNGGVPYPIPSGAAISVWYSGASGDGNYTDIGADSAVSFSGNEITVELIAQMLTNAGDGNLSIVINTADGDQIGTWNIPYVVEALPGMGSKEAEAYFSAFSLAVQNLPYPDATLSAAGKAADAKAVGDALAGKAPAGYGLGEEKLNPIIDDFYDAKETGLYLVGTLLSPTGTGGWMWVESFDENNKSYTFSDDRYGANCMQTTMAGGVIQPWDWANPPMEPGVEYRTTERYNGLAVYKMLDTSGNLWWRPENEETWRPEHGEGGGSGGEAIPGPTGPKGDPGKDGISCTHSWNGTVLTVTSASGTSSADLKGETGAPGSDGSPGQPGTDGADGYTPVRGTDYWTPDDQQAMQDDNRNFITTELAKRNQLAPEFVNSIKECTDTSKLYVLPDGYIYAWMYKEGGTAYTNLANPNDDDWKANSRINASGAIASSSESGAFVSNAFDCSYGKVLRVKGVRSTTAGQPTGTYLTVTLLNSSGGNVQGAKAIYLAETPPSGTTASLCMNLTPTSDGVYEYIIGKNAEDIWIPGYDTIVSARVGGIATDGAENVIITVDEEIVVVEDGYQWANTGHAFVPADYEDRIIALEESQTDTNKRIALIEEDLSSKKDAVGSLVNWCAMGDSITEGWVSYLDGSDPTSKKDSAKGWTSKLAELTGWALTNKAIGGAGFIDLENSDTEGVTAAWHIARNTDFKPYNLVTIAYGLNDWKGNVPLGTIGDAIETPTTIYGGMKATIEAIMDSNPLCKIIVLTPLNCAGYDFDYGTEATNWGLSKSFSNSGTLEDVFQAMVNVCEYYGIEYVDMTHKSVVNRKNILDCLTDGVHPNAETHTLLAYELAKKLNFVS